MAQTGGYPVIADIEDYLEAQGIEEVTENNTNFRQEFLQLLFRILSRTEFAAVLSVYCPTTTTYNVIGGKYVYKGVVTTYTPGANVDPTNNDTTYIWLTPTNTISAAVDGTGWPTTEHIKLAEIDVDSAGVITDVRDMRGQTFLSCLANYIIESAASVEALPIHWDSSSPAVSDECRLPVYGENSTSVKTEYARRTIKLTNVTNATEAAEYLLSLMVAGTLTELFRLTSAALYLINKGTGTSANVLDIHWNKATPVINDELRIPLQGQNDAAEKIEYARLVAKLNRIADGKENCEVKLSSMVNGTLTDLGKILTASNYTPVFYAGEIVSYNSDIVLF